MSGPDSNPSTATDVPQLLPASAGTREAVTLETPGWPASSSSSRSKSPFERSAEYPFNSGDTLNVIRLSMLIPRSTRLTLSRLFTKSPAHTSSAIEIAI